MPGAGMWKGLHSEKLNLEELVREVIRKIRKLS